MSSEKHEINSLNRAIEDSKGSHKNTREICSLLIGAEKNESPDFIRTIHDESSNEKPCIIGIEHFRVDHFSELTQTKKVSATGIDLQNEQTQLFNKHANIDPENDTAVYNAIFDTMSHIAENTKQKMQATYENFLSAFEHSLNTHLPKTDKYRKNLQDINPNADIQLIFLIEIHTDFSNLFLNDIRGIRRNDSGLMPLFSDVVRLLNTIDPDIVQYVVLQLNSYAQQEKTRVLAFPTRDIEKQLRRKNIKMYEYAGDDILFQPFESFDKNISALVSTENYTETDFDFVINYACDSMDIETRIYFMNAAGQKAHYCAKHNLNYTATQPVQMFMAVYGKNIEGWRRSKIKGEEWKVQPILKDLTLEIAEKRLTDFEKKYWHEPNTNI